MARVRVPSPSRIATRFRGYPSIVFGWGIVLGRARSSTVARARKAVSRSSSSLTRAARLSSRGPTTSDHERLCCRPSCGSRGCPGRLACDEVSRSPRGHRSTHPPFRSWRPIAEVAWPWTVLRRSCDRSRGFDRDSGDLASLSDARRGSADLTGSRRPFQTPDRGAARLRSWPGRSRRVGAAVAPPACARRDSSCQRPVPPALPRQLRRIRGGSGMPPATGGQGPEQAQGDSNPRRWSRTEGWWLKGSRLSFSSGSPVRLESGHPITGALRLPSAARCIFGGHPRPRGGAKKSRGDRPPRGSAEGRRIGATGEPDSRRRGERGNRTTSATDERP
jgi:hypothetical protein